MTLLPEYKATIIAKLEAEGEDAVRWRMMGGHFPYGDEHHVAVEWLGQKDRESRLRNDASQREQNTTARTAKNAAIVAAIAAIVTIVLAIIAIVISILAWVYPHSG